MKTLLSSLSLCMLAACAVPASDAEPAPNVEIAGTSAAQSSGSGWPRMVHISCDPRRVVGFGTYNRAEGGTQPCPTATAPWVGGNLFEDYRGTAVDGRAVCVYELPAHVPYTMVGLPNLPIYRNGTHVW